MELIGEDDVLDEHALHLDSPSGSDVFNNLPNGLCNLLATFDDILENSGSYNVTKSGLCSLNQSLADIGDTKSGFVWGGDVIVDNGGKVEGDVVLGHADLLWYLNNLNLDIDLDEAFAERVDLNETWVDCAVETSKLRDETDITLRDRLVWVRAADAARDCSKSSDARTKGVDHASVPAMSSLVAFTSQSLRIAGLEVLSSWGLHIHHRVVTAAWSVMRWTESCRWGAILDDIVRLAEVASAINGRRHVGHDECECECECELSVVRLRSTKKEEEEDREMWCDM